MGPQFLFLTVHETHLFLFLGIQNRRNSQDWTRFKRIFLESCAVMELVRQTLFFSIFWPNHCVLKSAVEYMQQHRTILFSRKAFS